MNRTKVILILIAAAVLSAVVWFLAQPDGSVVLLQAQRNLVEAETFRYEIELDTKGVWARKEIALTAGEEPIHLTGTVRSDLNRTDPVLPASVSSFDLTLASEGEDVFLRGDARRKDGRHYLRLKEASRTIFPGIERAINKWVFSDAPFTDFFVVKEEGEFEEFPLDTDGVGELEEAFSTIQVFRHLETLGTEEVDGVKNFHYRIGVSQEAVAALLLKKKELMTGVPVESEDFVEMLAKVSTWGDITGEVWIGKKDRRMRRIDLTTTLPEELGGATVSARTFLSRYGEPVEVDAPEAEDVMDLFGRILLGRLNLAGDRTIEEVIEEEEEEVPEAQPETGDSDGDGLSDSSESFYGSDAWNPDSDADGWPDGLEVRNGRDPMGPGVLFGFGL